MLHTTPGVKRSAASKTLWWPEPWSDAALSAAQRQAPREGRRVVNAGGRLFCAPLGAPFA